jgi:hypothetical protein
MTLLSNSITQGRCSVSNGGKGFAIDKMMFGDIGTISGSGTMVMYLDGEWVNPTVSFYYYGGFLYEVNGTSYLRSAGSISIYHRVKGATSAGTTSIMANVGIDNSGFIGHDSGDVSKTLTGTYDRLGLSISVKAYTGTFANGYLTIDLGNLKFGSQSVGFPTSVEFNNQE